MGRDYGRSVVAARQGIAATSQTLASQSAAQILAQGGSAVDAAITANAVLAVTEPMQCGPGGDLFVLHREGATGELTGLNASGPAPRALSREFMMSRGFTAMPLEGIHCVTVPGAVAGWGAMHARFGKLPWKTLFEAAIAYATEGFGVAEGIAELWNDPAMLPKIPAVLRIGDRPPREGELFRNSDLARTFKMIADDGPDAFYKGDIAAAIVKTAETMGGAVTAEDLAGFGPEWVEPISTEYKGWRVFELPPNGQGMAALEMLNIMEAADPALPEVHKRIEAMKLAYEDVHCHNCDPRCNRIPVRELISKEYARERAKLIDPKRANGSVFPGKPVGGDTTYLTVVDREGNIASWIQSNYIDFASGIAVNGFLLHNRGGAFTLEEGHPNVLAGGKRPFHTIIPGLMQRGSRHIGFGIMGGPNQPMAHAQFVSNFVDFGMNVQAAMEAPRFTKLTRGGNDVWIEARVARETIEQLVKFGHDISVRAPYTQEMGRGQAILHDSATGINFAASDPRADGSAIPEPIITHGHANS